MALADFNHIKTVLNTLDTLRPARFGYTESAVAATGANEITALTGVYVPEDSTQVNSIPTPDLIGVDPLIVNIGLRSQAASLTRMTANHFFGRLGLNLLKVTEKTKLLVEDHLVNRYITPSGDIMEDVTIEYEPDEITLIKHKSPLSASAPITSSAAVSLLAAIYDGNAGVMTGADKKKLDDTAANLNLSGLTSGRLLRYNSVSGRIESATVAETSGALSGITTLSLSGILTSTNTTEGGSGVGSIVTSGGIYAAKNIYSAGRVTGNTTTSYGVLGQATTGHAVRGEASGVGFAVTGVANTVGAVGVYASSTSGTALYVNGVSTFSADATINGLTVGRGGGNVASNTVFGSGALRDNVAGSQNVAMGLNTLEHSTGINNTAAGYVSLGEIISGDNNTAFGRFAGRYFSSTSPLTTATQSLFLGALTRASANGNTNEIVIGYNALGNGSNSVTLGNTSILKTILQGNVGIGGTPTDSRLYVGLASNTYYTAQIYNGGGQGLGLELTVGTGGGTGRFLYGKSIAGTERFYISDNGGAYFAGNVGIGGASTTAELSITGANADNELLTSFIHTGQRTLNLYGKWGSSYLGTENGFYLSRSGGSFGIGIDSTNAQVVVTSAGNVGIGTTSPLSNNSGLDISSGGLSLILGADHLKSTRTNVASKYARIGIAHHTNAELPFAAIFATSDAANNTLYFGGGTSQMNTATEIRFYTYANQITPIGTEVMRITSAGNVGIGATSHDAKLTVVGASSISFSNLANSYILAGTTTTGIGIDSNEIMQKGAAPFYIGTIDAQPLVVYTGATEAMRITSAGNVAIGSTNPGAYKLHVTGNIYATGTITAGSARALKENIVVSTINATDIIMKTDIMKFNYIADEKKEERIGFIADDTHAIMAGTEHNKIDLTNSIGVLIKALQESNKRIEMLEAKIRRNEVLR